MVDFTITDFDTGATKTNTETNKDNPLLSANQLGVEPVFCDRVSDGSRKAGWTEDVDSVIGGTITDQADYIEIYQRINAYAHVERDVATDNITIQGKLKLATTSVTASWTPCVYLYWDTDNWVGCGVNGTPLGHRSHKNILSTEVGSVVATGSVLIGTWYWYKVVLTPTTFTTYYSLDGISFIQITTGARPGSWSGAPALIIAGKGYSDNPTYPNPDMDNSIGTVATSNSHMTDMVVMPYQAAGTWESAVQTMSASSKMLNTTITHQDLSASDKITEIRWQVGGVTKATYSTDIVSGASTTIVEADLTSGTFDDVNADFTIEVDLATGGADTTPLITEIDGDYEDSGIVKFRFDGEVFADPAGVGFRFDGEVNP